MKQKVLLVAILMMALIMPAVAQNRPRTSPDKAKYSIIGTMNYRNGHRWLDNPVGKRIDFEYDETRPATATDKADLEVRFDFVHTDHPMTKLDFWRFDSEVGEWIYDSEVRQGDTVAVTKMQTNVMLVIDKSSSLKGDFPKVQEAAIEFVNQLYTASREKGVTFRVGVIAFSTIKFTEIREISTLNLTNYNEIVSFIRGLKMENGTALYYSLDKALDMLEKDTRMNIRPDEYRESRIYAFTDGLDQASIDDGKGLTTPTQYYESIRPKMLGPQRKLIMNMPRKIVRSTMVTVRGDDMTEKQIQLFDERAEQICDNIRKLDDMTKLVREFKELAADLVNSNFMLYCYIPEGANGLVGWTFRDDNIRTREEKPRERKPARFGLNFGYAPQVYNAVFHVNGLVQKDTLSMAGFFAGINYNINIVGNFGVSLGANFRYNTSTRKEYIVGTNFVLKQVQSFIDVPILFNYGLNVNDDLKISAFLGPTFSYAISGKTTSIVTIPEQNYTEESVQYWYYADGLLNRFDVSATVGINVQYKLLRLFGGYNMGLLNLARNANEEFKGRNWFVGFGICF